jgi:hypothetical protein
MLKLIDHASETGIRSETDVFSVPPTNVAVESGFWTPIYPTNTLMDSGPFEFRINSDPHYIHLAKNYLQMKLKIVNADGTAVLNTAQNRVGPINLIGKTLFKQVKIFIGGKQVSDSGDMYMYRSFLETHLNFGSAAKKTHLQSGLYHEDTPTNHLQDDQNTGWVTRRSLFDASAVVEVMAPIHADLFMSDRLLVESHGCSDRAAQEQ